jgi:hypothetical protein
VLTIYPRDQILVLLPRWNIDQHVFRKQKTFLAWPKLPTHCQAPQFEKKEVGRYGIALRDVDRNGVPSSSIKVKS